MSENEVGEARRGSGKPRVLPGREKALGMYERMVLIRKYEERIYFLFLEGSMPGSIHQSHGQEACAVGMLYDLGPDDYMLSTHRPAGHDLAKGVSLQGMMSEMFAKATGCCRGYGGAMHTGDIDVGVPPANAIVGGNIPIAAGIGLSFKLQGKKNVCVAFFGDGASNEGAFHEGANAAAVWNLPVILVCENNMYGASTPFTRTSKVQDVARRAASYDMPGEIVDGQDVLAVNEAATRAIERARGGKGPTLLELKTYRIGGHSRSDPRGYRTREEEAAWAARDAIQVYRQALLEGKAATAAELDAIDARVQRAVDESVEVAKAAPDPRPEDAFKNVYWEGAARP
jgi:acetoin:2,6-dichlorophenolindophenol oxidoreductase subunit alpha